MKLEKIYQQYILGIRLDFEKLTLYSIYLLSILVPSIIGRPQLLVGSIVNFLIVYSTLRYGFKKSIPILLLPSITATSMGMLFDGATYFLIYITPFIIISNILLSYLVSKGNIFNSILGIVLKGTFLFLSYKLMTEIVGLPSIFLTSSYLQFVTATVGVVLGISLYNLEKKNI